MQCTLELSDSASISLRSAQKTRKTPASVFPLPVGEVSKIDSRSRIAGTASNCAWVKSGKFSPNHLTSCGCKRRESARDVAAHWVCISQGERRQLACTSRLQSAVSLLTLLGFSCEQENRKRDELDRDRKDNHGNDRALVEHAHQPAAKEPRDAEPGVEYAEGSAAFSRVDDAGNESVEQR